MQINEFQDIWSIFLRFSANKGLLWHVVHKSCNYDIIFQKLDIVTVKMIPISTCYTSGWDISSIRDLFEPRPLHYKGRWHQRD